MQYDLVIRGARVVQRACVRPVTVAVRDGRVVGMLDSCENPEAAEHIDASGMLLMPGAIDTHVHLRDPGLTDREDFLTGTRCAAAGGITTILEMPTSEPPVNSGAVLSERVAKVSSKALVDFALYGAAGQENLEEIPKQAEAGAVGFKTFLTPPVPNQEKTYRFNGLWCTDAGLPDVMAAVKATGLRHSLHCENDEMRKRIEARVKAEGRRDGIAYARSRPPIVEESSVAMALAVAARVGAIVNLAHISTPWAAEMAKFARSRGVDVTIETCPQYLFMTEDVLREYGSFAKCNPPLRNAEIVKRMWDYIVDGTIDVLGTDHSPHLPQAKAQAKDDVFAAPSGTHGLEIAYPMMLTAVNEGRLDLLRASALLSGRAAEAFGLEKKGFIEIGYDADFVIVDMNSNWRFDWHDSFSKTREAMCIYQGREMKGKIVSTYVRGRPVYHRGEITGSPGYGQFLRPKPTQQGW